MDRPWLQNELVSASYLGNDRAEELRAMLMSENAAVYSASASLPATELATSLRRRLESASVTGARLDGATELLDRLKEAGDQLVEDLVVFAPTDKARAAVVVRLQEGALLGFFFVRPPATRLGVT